MGSTPAPLCGQVAVCRGVNDRTRDDSCYSRWEQDSVTTQANFSDSVKEISGHVLTVTYETLIPYVTFYRRGGNVILSGYLGDLWTVLENRLGFSSKYVQVGGNTARYMLQRGLADVYLAPTVVTSEEDELFDHTQPVVTHWYQLFVRKGQPQVSADSYVRALSPLMWLMTLAAMVLLCLVLRGVSWLRSRLGMASGMESGGCSLGSCFLSVVGSMCSQGWQQGPLCLSARMTMVTTLLFGYLLYNAYAGVLISYLASGNYGAPFSSLEEVAVRSSYTLCVRNESYAYASLKNNEKYHRVLNKGRCRGLSRSEQLVHVVCDPNTAVLEIPSVMGATMAMVRPRCQDDIMMIRGRTHRATASLLFRRGYPYIKAFDYMITRTRESGILDMLEKRYLYGHTQIGSQDGSFASVVQVSLEHVRWVLVGYGLFLCIPLLLLSGERVLNWRERRKQAKTRGKLKLKTLIVSRRSHPPFTWQL